MVNNLYPLDLSATYALMKTPMDTGLSPITIKNYVNRIDAVYKLASSNPYNGFIDLLIDYKTVITAINNSGFKLKSTYYTPIIKLFNYLATENSAKYENLGDIVRNHYYPEFMKYKLESEEQRNENITDATQRHRYLDVATILRRLESYDIRHSSGRVIPSRLLNKLLVSFYFLNPAWVPRNDLHTLILAGKSTVLEGSHNYLVLNQRKNPSHIVLNHYKTSVAYGQQIIKISKVVKDLLIQHIALNSRKVGEYLFSTVGGGCYTDSAFSNVVANAFNEVLDVPMNIDIVRQIQISQFNSTMPSNNQRIKYSKVFLHNLSTASQYIKLDIPTASS